MDSLMFDIDISDYQYYYARRVIQETIEKLENTFSKLDKVYYKISEPVELEKEGHKNYKSHCTVINQNSKYNWEEIKKHINKIYKGNYTVKKINNNIDEFKKIQYDRKNNIKIICSNLVANLKHIKTYSVGYILDGIKDVVYINKIISDNGDIKWEYDKTNEVILNQKHQNKIIDLLKTDPPIDIKVKQYLKPKIEVIDDLSKIVFEEEINVSENKNIDLYFCNAYYLFLTPLENYKYNYYDGYLELNIKDKTSKIELVIISDDNDRIYFEYTPTLKETLTLINAAEEYSQKINNKSLKELIEEIEEEEKNELY